MLQYVIVPGNNQHRAKRKQFLAQGDNGDPDRLILKQKYKSNTLTTAQDHILGLAVGQTHRIMWECQ